MVRKRPTGIRRCIYPGEFARPRDDGRTDVPFGHCSKHRGKGIILSNRTGNGVIAQMMRSSFMGGVL
jgi:hypothetical protein